MFTEKHEGDRKKLARQFFRKVRLPLHPLRALDVGTQGLLVCAPCYSLGPAIQVSGIASLLRSPSKRRSDSSQGDATSGESQDPAKTSVSSFEEDVNRVCGIAFRAKADCDLT